MLALAPSLLAADTPYEAATRPYFLALDQKCPDKKLQDLSPSDLNYHVELYKVGLPPSQDNDVTKAARHACSRAASGMECGNVAFLEVAQRDHFLDRFVDYLCRQPAACTGPGECTIKQ
jgi:hypothetical protein